ncbi:MAG TPA: hypothetical protein VNY73_09760, partial [Bacteroidia bacterium]|nr:hypothetical protein [Bacteroidia bacterium]
DYKKDQKTSSPASKELIETGYVSFADFLTRKECEDLYDQIIAFSQKYKETTTLDNGTLIHFRGNKSEADPDKGMIDIYNVDRVVGLNLDYEKIEKIIKPTTTCDLYTTSVHAYINRGVEGTRVFHVDNFQPVVYKAFIYLTDVDDTSYGPYAFINKTHRFSLQVYYNLFRNLFLKKYRSPDMPIYKKNREIIGTGKKGTIIISNQNGIHRGYPQEKGKERVALVVTYMVISKLNYLHNTAKQTLHEALKKF